jgi:phosphoribosylanthranilate isomerase
VGVYVDADPESVAAVARQAGLDVAQIHGGACAQLRCWRAYRVAADGIIAINDPGDAEAILLDTAVPGLRGGTGQSFPWHAARGLEQRVIIAGGLDASNVREAIRQARPWGVDACSRIESAPGRKDRQKMKAFIEEALAEFAYEHHAA